MKSIKKSSNYVALAVAAHVALVSLILLALPVQGQDQQYYAASNMPIELRADQPSAVVRLDRHVFDVKSPGKATYKGKRIITVLGPEGRDIGYMPIAYDKFRQLKKLEGRIRDSRGKVVRKLKKDDIVDYSNIADYSLYDDSRMRIAKLFHNSFPYTVEYEFELEYDGLIGWHNWYPQASGLAVQSSEFQISSPEEFPIRFKTQALEMKPAEEINGGRRTLSWQVTVLPKAEEDAEIDIQSTEEASSQEMPAVFTAPTIFEIGGAMGDMSSWESFGQWYYKLSEDRDQLPADVLQHVQNLTAGIEDPVERARLVYQYLQENNRYVSVQLGLGGWQPFEPEYVARNGYGDCKALTNYLKALLHAVDVPAHAVLINSGIGNQDLRADFPSNQFNHVVLMAPLPADTLWLEATDMSMPFGHLGAANEDRFALQIASGSSKLVRTPKSNAANNAKRTVAVVRLEENGQAYADVRNTYLGNQADRVRRSLVHQSSRERNDWLRESLSIPSFEVTRADFATVEAREDSISLPFELALPRYAAQTGSRLFFQPNLMERWVSEPPEKEISRAFNMAYPFLDEDDVHFVLPAGYKIEALPDPVEIENEIGRYSASIEVNEDGTMRYRRHFELFDKTIEPAEYPAFRSFFKEVSRADNAKVVIVKQT